MLLQPGTGPPTLAVADQAALTAYMFPRDAILRADVTIVLGMTLYERPVERSLELYRSGWSGRLLFSGGHNERLERSEAVAMAERARVCGVPEGDIILEPRATNTHENFRYARELIQSEGLDPDHCQINIVAIHYHIRRAIVTARHVFPTTTAIGLVSYPSIHYLDMNWWSTSRGCRDVLSEVTKMERYFPNSVPADLLSIVRAAFPCQQ